MAERNPYDNDADGVPRPPGWLPEQAAAERIAEIRQYLSDLHASRDVVTRTVTKSGEELDWVPIESQISEGTMRTIRTKSAKIIICTIDRHLFRQMRPYFRHNQSSIFPILNLWRTILDAEHSRYCISPSQKLTFR